MRLARERRLPLREVVATTTARDFALWEAFEEFEPSAEWKADARAAMIAMTVHNAACVKTSDLKPIGHFMDMLKPAEAPPKLDPKIVERRMMKWAKRHNATQRRGLCRQR